MKRQVMETIYSSLLAKKNDPSKDYYMLSELIDNSIGSWLGDDEYNKKREQLKIVLTINYDDKSITIIDNARGMDAITLENSIRLNDEKKGNVLNMFGVGLKNAAFWYGTNLEIFSKTEKGVAYETSIIMEDICKDKKAVKNSVTWEVKESKKWNDRGTKVVISDIYEERNIKERTLQRDILPIIARKFCRYLENENIEILVKYIANGKMEEGALNTDWYSKPQIINDEYVDKFTKNFKKSLEDKKNNGGLKKIFDMEEKVLELVKNKKPLEFESDLKFDDKDFHFIFGVQNQEQIKTEKGFNIRYGLATFQKNRAINIPPINHLQLGEYTRTNIKRIYAEVELGDYYRPDNNKQSFNLIGKQEDFHKFIKDIGSDLLLLADAVQNTIGTSKRAEPGNRSETNRKIGDQIKSKSDLQWDADSPCSFCVKDKNGNDFIRIVEESSDSDFFIDVKENKENSKILDICFNVNHPIWKPLTTMSANVVDSKSVIYPIVSIMGILLNTDKKNIICEQMGVSKYSNDNLSEILKVITRYMVRS